MTDWLRLWHEMPTDPKWRVVARRSRQSIGNVIAVFNFMLVNASENEAERGTLRNFSHEDVAAALDIEDQDVADIRAAMQGKVLDGDRLLNWEKRQPKREDNSTERVREFRKRNETQRNAPEKSREDTDNTPPSPPPGGFDEFWNIYPEKSKQQAAERAFEVAITKASLSEIISGVRRYIAAKPKGQAWKGAAGWLDSERWKDHPAPVVVQSTAPKRTWLEIKAEKDRLAARQADDGSGPKPISSITPTVLIPIEGHIS